MLKLPISASTFKRSFLGGNGSLQISSDQDVWQTLVDANAPFTPKVDSIADVQVSLGTEKALSLGREGDWKVGVSASIEAGHQIQLIWPGGLVAPGIVRGMAPAAGDLLVRLVLHGQADASVKNSVPIGPLSATFGVAAEGSVGYERLVTFPGNTPARQVLKELFAGIRFPQQVDSAADIPAAGEVLVSRHSGYLKLSGKLSYGYSVTGTRETDIGQLNLDLDYQLKLGAAVSAAYSLAGSFELEARAGATPNFARFVVSKSRESEFNFAADFGLDAKLHLKGLPDSADEFLVKAMGAHAEFALKLFDKARTFSNLDQFEKAAGKLLQSTLQQLSDQFIGKALTNASFGEFFAKMQAIAGTYNALDARIVHLYEDFLEDIPGLSKTLDLLVTASNRDKLREVVDSKAWELVNRLAGPRLHDILMEQPAFEDFAQVVNQAKAFLTDGGKQEIRDLVAGFKKSFPLDQLFFQLRKLQKPQDLKNLADAKLQGLAEKLLGKTFEEIRSSNAGKELKALNESLDKIASFKSKYYEKLKQVADSSFRASLHLAYSRASASTALLDVEVDVSTAEGSRLAKLAASGDFSEL